MLVCQILILAGLTHTHTVNNKGKHFQNWRLGYSRLQTIHRAVRNLFFTRLSILFKISVIYIRHYRNGWILFIQSHNKYFMKHNKWSVFGGYVYDKVLVKFLTRGKSLKLLMDQTLTQGLVCQSLIFI